MSANQLLNLYKAAPNARQPSQIRSDAVKELAVIKTNVELVNLKGIGLNVLKKSAAAPTQTGLAGTTLTNVDLDNCLIAFAAYSGVFYDERYWVKVKANQDWFAGFPELTKLGKKGVLQWALADRISLVIMNGGSTNLMDFCSRAGITLDSSKQQYCFAKGHTVSTVSDKTMADAVRTDNQAIIESMVENKNSTVIVNPPILKYLDRP
jgi:hypothetical protein